MTDQKRVRDYADMRKPVLYKEEQLGPVPVPSKGRIYPGYVGHVTARRAYGFVGFRIHERHYHVNQEGYCLTLQVLRRMAAKGVRIVLIAEEDTGTVYEWHINDFDTEVPDKDKGPDEQDETQYSAQCETAAGVFEDHVDDVMIGPR